ncbi:flagellar hook-associated protein FlgK [Curtobacterium sp. MCBD17_040]|uniref:flagellar hook-associated protein FlgK n=1 Tax=Curtobacterium sp. MCBD17_040 TaxID=2175674 RepID=UPI000DAA522B|nr:flagellar hook-associated protein FlgK [Curtobacterium sp. MCBD17_040]WIB65564.1 flagellar hook-associated protein FlgK [Curtobacterium sp. MCBD17_040]
MAGTFSGIQSAYSGLTAAQTALNVVGQNIDNASTAGYVRQRVEQTAVGSPAQVGLAGGTTQAGQGVLVTAISNLSSVFLDSQVRAASAANSYTGARATGYTSVETALGEPSDDALSSQMNSFWSAWSDVSNQPGNDAPVGALLGQAQTLTTQIGDAYRSMQIGWSNTYQSAGTEVDQLNALTSQVATLNGQIRSTIASGNNANELTDERSQLAAQISALAGGSVAQNSDNTINITIGGSNVVDGTNARQVSLSGADTLENASANPVTITWSDQVGGAPLSLTGGSIAGNLSLLAGANPAGTGGAYAQAADALNTLATSIATSVNAVSETGATANGTTGTDFFSLTAGQPAALSISVIPTNADGVAVGTPGAGANDGSVADQISQIGTGATSPSNQWSTYVVSLGTQSSVETQQSTLATTTYNSAVTSQQSQEGVDLDEESMNLLEAQHAYQGAARVMTAMDQMLDQLINHTGTVGIS